MFITFGYLVIELYNWYARRKNPDMRFLQLLRDHVKKGSILIRAVSQAQDDAQRLSNLLASQSIHNQTVLTTERRKQILSVAPKVVLNLQDWTAYLDQQNFSFDSERLTDSNCFVMFETTNVEDEEDFLNRSFSIPSQRRVKVVDCTKPLAWKPGQPFGIVAACDLQNLSLLTTAFMEGRLILDDMLELSQMMTVEIEGRALKLLRAVSSPGPFGREPSGSDAFQSNGPGDTAPVPSGLRLELPPTVGRKLVSDLVNADQESYADSNESLADFDSAFPTVKSADQNGCDGDSGAADMMSDELMDSTAGEAPSAPIAELAPETMTPVRRAATNQSKPPNVLVYTGKKDATRHFEAVKSVLQHCLNCDRYAIYQLKHEQVHTTPWAQNAVLLVVSSERAYDGAAEEFVKFFQSGGSVIFFGCAADAAFVKKRQTASAAAGIVPLTYKQHSGVSVISARFEYEGTDSVMPSVQVRALAVRSGSNTPLILEATHDETGGAAILSQAQLDADPVDMAISPDIFAELKQANPARFEILKDLLLSLGLDCSNSHTSGVTPAVLLSVKQEQREQFLRGLKPRLNEKDQCRSRHVTLHFAQDMKDVEQPVKPDVMPILVNHESDTSLYQFNWTEYKQNLKTEVLGQTVIYSDIMTSTMHALDGIMLAIPKELGLVAIATRQTSGVGRGGNVWLSPLGCAMSSVHVRVSMTSHLGQRPAFLQHIAGLAVVEALTSLQGYQTIDVRLKWPNDIWFSNKMKLGGVLVQSTIMQQTMHANVGIGFNVTNKNPTICLNDLIEQHNKQHGTRLRAVTTAQMIARMLSCLETLIDEFQEQGPEPFLNRYYKRWLHSDAVVKVERNDHMTVKILGLDDHGYLLAEKPDGGRVSLQDDGNSFDMMANLIRIKAS